MGNLAKVQNKTLNYYKKTIYRRLSNLSDFYLRYKYYNLLMSVYIKIKEATFESISNLHKPILIVSSSDAILEATPSIHNNNLVWNKGLISSIKEKKLLFQIRQEITKKTFACGQLYYSSLRPHLDNQFTQTVRMDNGGFLILDIFYTDRQNFIGEISFYSYQNTSKSLQQTATPPEITRVYVRKVVQIQPHIVRSAPKSSGLFFCCGDEGDDKQFTIEEDLSNPLPTRSSKKEEPLTAEKEPIKEANLFPKEFPSQPQGGPMGVQFYKGPCKTTNLFSCCDAGLEGQNFTVIEDYYRDK